MIDAPANSIDLDAARAAAGTAVPEAGSSGARAGEELEWLARARRGDLVAFDWLLERYRDRVVRLASHVLRRPAEAEDAAQEAFLRAFSQIRSFRGDCAFYTWIYQIVVRVCLNRLRRPQWLREMDLEVETWPDTGFEVDAHARTEDRMVIEMLLDRLSPTLRAALVLRELEGLEYTEIAEALGIPVGTVRSRLSAARAQFRALWEKEMNGDG